LGAALVFFARSVHQALLDIMLGFAAGVMIAASFWSLLAPSIEMASAQGMPSWVPPTVGFLLGGVFLRLGDALRGVASGAHLRRGPCWHAADSGRWNFISSATTRRIRIAAKRL
jgi:zinc transporter ZupT